MLNGIFVAYIVGDVVGTCGDACPIDIPWYFFYFFNQNMVLHAFGLYEFVDIAWFPTMDWSSLIGLC